MHFLERVEQREAVGDDRRVVVLLVEDRRSDAAGCGTPRGTSSGCRPAAASAPPCRRASGRSDGRTRRRAASTRQPVLLVLDVAPEQVVERPQRIDLEMRQRIAVAGAAHVLEAPADRVHASAPACLPRASTTRSARSGTAQSTRGRQDAGAEHAGRSGSPRERPCCTTRSMYGSRPGPR